MLNVNSGAIGWAVQAKSCCEAHGRYPARRNTNIGEELGM